MNNTYKNIIAVCIGILPVNIIMIWYRLTQTEAFTTFDMLVYPLLFGGGNILLILALNKYLLNKELNDFYPGKSSWKSDIVHGLILTVIYFVLMFIEQATIIYILPQGKPASREVIHMMIDLAHNPLLLMIWLGPVVWIGVALFEEIARTFFLNCLWRISKNTKGQIFSIFLVSIFSGIIHLYQGAFGIVSVTIMSLVISFYYYKFRRLLSLVISHALYDSMQIIMFVGQVSG